MELRLLGRRALTETYDVDSREKPGGEARDDVRCIRALSRDARIRDSEHATPPSAGRNNVCTEPAPGRYSALSSDKSVHYEEAECKHYIFLPVLIHSILRCAVSSGYK